MGDLSQSVDGAVRVMPHPPRPLLYISMHKRDGKPWKLYGPFTEWPRAVQAVDGLANAVVVTVPTTGRKTVIDSRPDEPIVWTGNLKDDCVARWCGLIAHAECMSGRNDWFFSVSREGESDCIFHTGADAPEGWGKCEGKICRLFAEHIMRRVVAEARLAALSALGCGGEGEPS